MEKTSISGLTTAASTMKLTIPKGIPDENSVITMQTKV
jgi:hypothetical protein